MKSIRRKLAFTDGQKSHSSRARARRTPLRERRIVYILERVYQSKNICNRRTEDRTERRKSSASCAEKVVPKPLLSTRRIGLYTLNFFNERERAEGKKIQKGHTNYMRLSRIESCFGKGCCSRDSFYSRASSFSLSAAAASRFFCVRRFRRRRFVFFFFLLIIVIINKIDSRKEKRFRYRPRRRS